MNKREKISLILAIAGIVWWFAENFYFGWHLHATSIAEGICDQVVWFLWIIAFFVRPTNIKVENNVINTKTVEFIRNDMSNINFGTSKTKEDKEQNK